MDYNKNGEVNKYFNLDEILKLDLPSEISLEIKEKFGKRVFYDYNDNCRVGTLCGLEINHKLSTLYYIIENINKDNKDYIPTWKSITRV